MKFKTLVFLVSFLNSLVVFSQKIEVFNERELNLGLENQILVENHLTANPTNGNHLLLSGMFVNKKNTSVYGNYAITSFDKGKTWQNLTKFDLAEGADPWGLITPDNVAISTVLGLEELFIFRSEDGGKNWNNGPVSLGRAHDHQTLIQDLARKIVYLVSIQGNHIYVNYSKDNGKTFDNPKKFKFSNLGSNTMTPVLLEDGTLMISYTTFNRPAIGGSRNRGKSERLNKTLSWIIPYSIDGGFRTPLFLSEECETGFPVLANNLSAKGYEDNMYYVCSSQTTKSIMFHYSNTKGQSWTEGISLSSFTTEDRSKRNPFTGMPQVTVNNKGVIGVIWQNRIDDKNGKCQFLYFTASIDGGKSFLPPVQVSSQLSCMENERNDWAGSRYKSGGDYTGFLSDNNGDFLVIWPDSRDGISKLYMANIKISK
ncbi:MAG: exo-alpha-sialidase [Bacteroidota bacterium]